MGALFVFGGFGSFVTLYCFLQKKTGMLDLGRRMVYTYLILECIGMPIFKKIKSVVKNCGKWSEKLPAGICTDSTKYRETEITQIPKQRVRGKQTDNRLGVDCVQSVMENLEYSFEVSEEVKMKIEQAEDLHRLISEDTVQDLKRVVITKRGYCKVKRIYDIIFSLLGLVILLIPFAVISAAIYIDDPVSYTHLTLPTMAVV